MEFKSDLDHGDDSSLKYIIQSNACLFWMKTGKATYVL